MNEKKAPDARAVPKNMRDTPQPHKNNIQEVPRVREERMKYRKTRFCRSGFWWAIPEVSPQFAGRGNSAKEVERTMGNLQSEESRPMEMFRSSSLPYTQLCEGMSTF